MFPLAQALFLEAVKLLLVAFGVLYVGLVLMTYRTDGPRYPLRIDLSDPARSAERLLLWLGVRALDGVLRLGRAMLDVLSETSAQVGEWYISRRSVKVQSEFRSRYL